MLKILDLKKMSLKKDSKILEKKSISQNTKVKEES